MNPAAWKIFLDAAECGSLTKVAALHGTSQPQVSRIIRELETASGGRLFQRNGRGVSLSELGARVAPRVRAWLESTEELANDIRSDAGIPAGKVRIGSLPSTAHPLLTTVYARLAAAFPRIQLTVREGQGAQLETWLEEGTVDLALLFRMSAVPRNGDIYLADVPTFLVSAADDPITSRPIVEFNAIHKLPLVLFCRPSSWRNTLEDIAAAHAVTMNVVLEADSLSLQTSIAAAGGIYALLGPNAIAAATAKTRVRASKLVAPTIHRYVALAMSPRTKMTLANQTVMRFIREAAGQ